MARVRVERSKQLSDKLKRIREKTQTPVRAALARGGNDIVSMARRLAPDGAGTGEFDYKSSIHWRFGSDDLGGTDPKTGRSASTSITIIGGDKNNIEGAWLEFGTAPHVVGGRFKGAYHPGTSPQPHFFPAYRANKKAIVRMVNKAIRDAIKDSVR